MYKDNVYINSNQSSVCLYFRKRQVRLWVFFSRPLNWKTADSSKIPNWQFSFLSRVKADPFQLGTFQFIFFFPFAFCRVLPFCHSAVCLTALWAAHPHRNDLLGDPEALSAMARLLGEGLCHFMWNNKEQWQSAVPAVLSLKALIVKRVHTHTKKTFTARWKGQQLSGWSPLFWCDNGVVAESRKSLWLQLPSTATHVGLRNILHLNRNVRQVFFRGEEE